MLISLDQTAAKRLGGGLYVCHRLCRSVSEKQQFVERRNFELFDSRRLMATSRLSANIAASQLRHLIPPEGL